LNLQISLGAIYQGEGRCQFRVWAPIHQKVALCIVSPRERIMPLEEEGAGYHYAIVEGIKPGDRYLYCLDGQKELPDPASRSQPEGVYGPSRVVDPQFPWEDDTWFGLPLQDYVIYELHVGTFTPGGTFEAIISHLDELKDLGVTAVELMPVAQFPGSRNWGYDGAYPFAVQNSYGGPDGLKRLVNECHRRDLALVLDVVYNHLGPEGNYLWDFGPYFTDRYKSPWGSAVNFDGPESDEVRRFFIENALSWVTEFHIDALRIDAVHSILDFSACPFLEELASTVHDQAEQLKRRIYLIAESALNDTRVIRSRNVGGYGLDAQWNDDFHHVLHTLLTGEQTGYYQDFGRLRDLAKAFRDGFVYSGQYSPYRRRRHGNSSQDIPAHQFVVFAQNHDQVGNRMHGERLSELVCPERTKLAAGIVLLSPFIPLLFMGEEYGETAPFPYFISHSDPALIDAVRRGRREEFSAFGWPDEPPDPQDERTFLRAKLNHGLRRKGYHRVLLELYGELLQLRKGIPALGRLSKGDMDVLDYESDNALVIRRWSVADEVVAVFHFGKSPTSIRIPFPKGKWRKRLDSADERWQGPGSQVPDEIITNGELALSFAPYAFVIFVKEREV
jgi:maltooligosyltrehalose trehalohydrolase